MIYLCAFLIAVVAGLRAMMAPAAVSWAAYAGWISLEGTFLAFLAYPYTPWILTALAIGELIADQLPKTPSRKVPIQFGTRLLMGAVCGIALTLANGQWLIGLIVGLLGAVAGTLGGHTARASLARRFGRDLPAALIEDGLAFVLALLVLAVLR
ncbi:DUF4126 family protein [Pseudoxanthomonas sp. UTMC 1351]|uniref:DUF4126 family protein n=1 Tax=Pseudoxanthomonas sp. UTMC 1351 TaxID=2695853 RepID=UPI0034CD11B5